MPYFTAPPDALSTETPRAEEMFQGAGSLLRAGLDAYGEIVKRGMASPIRKTGNLGAYSIKKLF